ncbi:hypothetical protein LOTGIDRAFT_229571 [Lottia gigantea]|uniref:Ig-like domain-containing protein n=1 Tax=Lottia gigantea TaxID=225164 RepID=V3Z0M8_LOTGI|nr:hypothetical protein LOTGIDRAFT_229571 [Lottia gigantea]ESO84038.1 hypothetical protein LOTGIDRAFT_229571 [Lottia gigantea]
MRTKIWTTLFLMLLSLECTNAMVITSGMSLTSTNNNPAVDSSVTLTCHTPGYDEITWSGPNGVFIIFAPNCFRLSEAESTHITYISVSCGGGSSVLTINNFDPARDAGGWSCSGYSTMGSSDSASITLTAAASEVENIKITTDLAFIDHYDTISLLYGEKETIHCSADCQNSCQFTWHLNNQLVSSSDELVIDLQSTPATPGGKYICTASSGGDSITKNVTINRWARDTIIFSPPDDILNVNEGDNVTVICDGTTNSHYCSGPMNFECYTSWNTMSAGYTSSPLELSFYNITLDKTGRHYCIHNEFEESSNTQINLYKSVQINVIDSSTSATPSTTTTTTPSIPSTTPSSTTSITPTTPSTTEQPTTTTQDTPGMSLTSTNNNPTVDSSVTLTCQTLGFDEITWRGPSGVYILFINCLRLSEAETTRITYISVSCGGLLTINNFDPGRDAGTWSCSGNSIGMMGLSDSASITLTAAASHVKNIKITTDIAFIDHYDTISLLYGEKETIHCSADCQNRCQFTWHLNNQLVSSCDELVIDVQTPGGKYMCTASSGVDSITKNVTINRMERDTIIFSPPDDILNVNEGDNVTVICGANSYYCSSQMNFECYTSWNTMSVGYTSSPLELSFYNITLDKTGRHYCIHDAFEESSNTQFTIYRSVQINVIANSTSATSPSTTTQQPTTTTPDPSGMSLTSTNNNPAVDSSVTLTCQAHRLDVVTWNGPNGVYISFSTGCYRLIEKESNHISYISVSCGGGKSVLTINNFDPARDSGSWSCSTYSDSASINLIAIASHVESIKITSEIAYIDYHDSITLLNGEKETIHCSADCQNSCQFTWHLNNQLVSSCDELVIDLQSTPASPGGKYMCTASSGSDSLSKNVTLYTKSRDTIKFSPPDTILNVNEGDNVTVICDGMDDYSCSGFEGVDCTDSWNTMSTSHELKFYNIELDKTGKYYCIHEVNEQSSNTRYKYYRSVQINVLSSSTSTVSTTSTIPTTPSTTTTPSLTTPSITEQPTTTTQDTPEMSLTSTNYNPTVDSLVTLSCVASSYDEITWTGPSGVYILFSGCFRISEAESTHITYISVSCGGGGSDLTINSFDPARDAGSWSCSGNSIMGLTVSASITLTATASEVENIKITTDLAFIDHYDTISLLYGEKETIHCSADCHNSCQFTWHLNNQLVSSSDELVIDLQSTPVSPGGKYMCTATSGGDSITKNVTINRMERDTIIFSPPDTILNVNEGDNVTVICDENSYYCSSPTGFVCDIYWNTMSVGYTSSPLELSFYNITLDKTGRHYCIHDAFAKSSNTQINLYKSVQINVKDTPGMSLTSTNYNPEVDSSVTLTCQTLGFDEITWTGPSGVFIIFAPNCFRISEAESTHITYISVSCGGGSSVLTINNFDPGRDAGRWSCSGNSVGMVGSSDSASIILTAAASEVENIKITTDLAFIDHYDTISLLYGEKETIHCSADCQNSCQFTWHLNNQLVSSSDELVFDLQSTPATPTPGGKYMCTASSGGDSITRNVTINMQSRETIIFSPPDDILNVNEGDNVTVICDGKTNDYGCAITGIQCTDSWYTMSTSHELRFYNIELDKTGKYYCIHEFYEQSSNTRYTYYRSVQINVIATTTSVLSSSTSGTTSTILVTSSSTSVLSSSTSGTTSTMPVTASSTSVLSSSTSGTTSTMPVTASSTSVLSSSTSGTTSTMPVTASSTSVLSSSTSGTTSTMPVTASSTSVLSSSTSGITSTMTETTSPTSVLSSPTSGTTSTMPETTSSNSITTSYTSNTAYTETSPISATTPSTSPSTASSYITSLRVDSSSDPQHVQEGSDLKLTCFADCQPVDSCVYTWKFNDNMIANTHECKMDNITRQATGTYTCSASNGQTMSKAIDVKVNYPPSAMTISRVPDKSAYNVKSSITLTCNVDCVPKPTLTWRKGSEVILISNTFNYLSLSNVLTGDSGEYTCTADNGIGDQTATTSINIKYIPSGSGGSGASSMYWMSSHKILLMIVIVYILH